MRRTTTMTVRLSGALGDFVSANVGENGAYENVSEYIRDLIRRDKAEREAAAFEAVKARLQAAFAAPRSDFDDVSADDIRALAADHLQK